jgi:NAD(P)-dependent dehydrogenase (short-subunit alcohol dehydrogenase family)
MKIQGQSAIVTGGGSGLGEAVARELARQGAKVAVLDVNAARRAARGGRHRRHRLHLRRHRQRFASRRAGRRRAAHGVPRIVMNIAGIGKAKRIIGKDGSPAPLEDFERVVRINLIGTYNVARLAAARIATLDDALADGERGVIVNTASVAAFDGQVGQEAYSASKGGVVGMTLPLARDLAQWGMRVCTIAPGLFKPRRCWPAARAGAAVAGRVDPLPQAPGNPAEFAALARTSSPTGT